MLQSKVFWAVLVAISVIICVIIYFLSRTPGGEETVDTSDTPIDITKYSKILDPYRADWDIFGRFESWPTVVPLAKIAAIAYDAPERAIPQFKKLGFTSVVPIHSPLHTQIGYVISSEDVAVIAFRGSDDTEDWILNVNQYIHQGEDGGMHAGFSTCYSTLRQDLLTAIRNTNPKPKHIWITGHSLGGALALICAYDFQRYHNVEFDGVFTFGQPMVGREQFTGYLQNKIGDRYVHFVNELDGVPRIPAGFSHCGRLIWFNDGKISSSKRYRQLSLMTQGSDTAPPSKQEDDIEYLDDNEFPTMSNEKFEKLQDNLKAKQDQLFPEDKMIPNETFKWEEITPGLRKPLRTTMRPRLGASGEIETGEIKIEDPIFLEEIPVELQKFEPGQRPMTALFVDKLPWATDHNMIEYIEKIEARIKKVSLGGEE